MDDCIFCRIISGDAPAMIVHQDEQATAFWDAHSAAPVHILIVPNIHIASVNELLPEHESLAGHLMTIAGRIASEQGLSRRGYRLMINTGPESGQSVFHLHLHLMGGRVMPGWTM